MRRSLYSLRTTRPLYSLRKTRPDFMAEMSAVAAMAIAKGGFGAPTQVDTWSGTIATVAIPQAEGNIGIVQFWNPATNEYQATAPNIVLGQEAGILVPVFNPSLYPQRMRVDANGFTGYETVVQPGGSSLWAFKWTPTEPGPFQITATLFAEYSAA